MPRSRHRTGRPYRRAREQMFAIYGHTCHLCGHDGAHTADHLTPVSLDPEQPISPHDMRPAHGTRGGQPPNPCPTCGRLCNQERGAGPVDAVFTPALTW